MIDHERLREAARYCKRFIDDENVLCLLNLAEKYLAVVQMPKKKQLPDIKAWEESDSYPNVGTVCIFGGYVRHNEAIDSCTLAHMKLMGEKDAEIATLKEDIAKMRHTRDTFLWNRRA